MTLSVLDLFTIGIGPSSSHTVGPMRAAGMFAASLDATGDLRGVDRVSVDLYGSLGATGRGHGTEGAILVGLEGAAPETVEPAEMAARVAHIRQHHRLCLGGRHEIGFDPELDLRFHPRQVLPAHSNGLTLTAWSGERQVTAVTMYSIGGGFVVDEHDLALGGAADLDVPHPFDSAGELLRWCRLEGASVAQIMARNEDAARPRQQTEDQLRRIWAVMQGCVSRGCEAEGVLPGALRVARRAPRLHQDLLAIAGGGGSASDTLSAVDWLTVYAIAVNEENAAGGRVVTAPTNGAAGIIPAVLHYYWHFCPGADEDGVIRFLLAAAAIGIIIKEHASISGADVGCQGEVGSACAMAAAGLTEVLGGTPEQVENAAEIGLEHNLGLTCDPVGGLVQVPCIERNAVAAVKAVTASRLALRGDGTHRVSLDQAVETLRQTGADMSVKYKETSTGGLAVNVIEC
ncbi:MAG TPA: L-serine ammonia-lyase [Ornithinimicrobium sp.]|uniref:L-serine ammonia-lyase n=1 Tax=Ornithinimicrobium sp. TaxID=1977084 RepID=UPI002B47AFBB|nr:L-serine ammonia-lyase [Ornithinimicrobium sp.]HKJ12284.1 L-serine ammonia-lyase [Ornithinimicrobium sp.]